MDWCKILEVVLEWQEQKWKEKNKRKRDFREKERKLIGYCREK